MKKHEISKQVGKKGKLKTVRSPGILKHRGRKREGEEGKIFAVEQSRPLVPLIGREVLEASPLPRE